MQNGNVHEASILLDHCPVTIVLGKPKNSQDSAEIPAERKANADVAKKQLSPPVWLSSLFTSKLRFIVALRAYVQKRQNMISQYSTSRLAS